jgi:hypothetical protein
MSDRWQDAERKHVTSFRSLPRTSEECRAMNVSRMTLDM